MWSPAYQNHIRTSLKKVDFSCGRPAEYLYFQSRCSVIHILVGIIACRQMNQVLLVVVECLLNVLIIREWSLKDVYHYVSFTHVYQHVILEHLQFMIR